MATIGEPGARPLLAVVGHIDEIGLVITHVDEKGLLYFAPVGGWDAQILVGQRVRLETRAAAGARSRGRKAIHLLKAEQKKQAVELRGCTRHRRGGRERALELVGSATRP